LEDTLFGRLEEMRKKPPGELFELLERTLEVLRATKEALLEQRREIRTLATAVDSLRSRVDQLVLSRSESPRHVEPLPDFEPEPEPEPEPELPPAAEAEPEPEPEPEPVDEYRHEDEYEHEEPEPTHERAYEVAVEEAVVEEPVVEEPALEEPVVEEPEPEPAYEEPVSEEPIYEEPVTEGPPEPAVLESSAEHVLMLSTTAGYRLVTGEGAEPEAIVEIDGVVYLVGQRVGSPFPGDERPAYVAAPAVAADDEY
jgi:hypothetical protein